MPRLTDRVSLTQAGRHSEPPKAIQHRMPVSKAYFWLGLALLSAVAIQQTTGWRWPLLSGWQDNPLYKQATGFGLLAFVLHQWRFSVNRAQGESHNGLAMLRRHKLLGSLAPLLFFFHSQALGYGYAGLLSLMFLSVVLTGLGNAEILNIRRRWYRPAWIGLHVSSSMALLFLLAYHVYLGYAFK